MTRLKTRFVHFRGSEFETGATVAFEFTGERDAPEREVVFGVSFCNRKDTFNRATGRMIAENRLNCDRTCRQFTVKLNSFENINIQIICAIREFIMKQRSVRDDDGKIIVKGTPQNFRDPFSMFWPTFGLLDPFMEQEIERRYGLVYHGLAYHQAEFLEDPSGYPMRQVFDTTDVFDNV